MLPCTSTAAEATHDSTKRVVQHASEHELLDIKQYSQLRLHYRVFTGAKKSLGIKEVCTCLRGLQWTDGQVVLVRACRAEVAVHAEVTLQRRAVQGQQVSRGSQVCQCSEEGLLKMRVLCLACFLLRRTRRDCQMVYGSWCNTVDTDLQMYVCRGNLCGFC